MSSKRSKPEDDDSFIEEDAFKKSRVIVRTPTKDNKDEKEKQKMEEIMKLLTEMRQEIKTEIQDLKAEVKEENKETRQDIKELKEEIKQNNEEIANIKLKMQKMEEEWVKEKQELKQENELIKTENKKITEDMEVLRRTLELLEKEKKKNNLIISGIIIDTEDPILLKRGIENMIENHLGLKTDIKKAQKIGIKTCVIELNEEEQKSIILQNKNKLKKIRTEKIWITEDLTQGEKEKMKALRELAKDMRNEGRTVKIGYNKITVDGTEWRWNYKEKKIMKPLVSKN